MLPPLYQRWIDELLPEGIPEETRSTCDACAMLDRGELDGPDLPFNPATKCCTYHPELPNYLIGAVLLDDHPDRAAARAVLEERIVNRIGVSPYGLTPPPAFTLVYHNASVFGRSEAMRCPFYLVDGGRCGIHPHREGVCATYFCKYERGATGKAFWRVMNAFLKALDIGLRAWALDQVDDGGTAATGVFMYELGKSKTLDENTLQGHVTPAEYGWTWGRWTGSEAELYRRCAKLVAPLDLKRVLEICGAQTLAASRVVKLLRKSLDRAPPAKVAQGGGVVQLGKRPGFLRLKNAVAPYDFRDVPAEIVAAVPLLTSGLLAEALADMREAGLELNDETLRWLLDFEIIVPAPG